MFHQCLAKRCTLIMLTVATLWAVPPTVAQVQSDIDFRPVTDEMLQDPPPEHWLMWRRTLDSWGYSPLNQIDRNNADELRLVWTRALNPGSNQGTPLVYDGIMYMPNPSDVIQAIDAVSGDLQWETSVKVSKGSLKQNSNVLASAQEQMLLVGRELFVNFPGHKVVKSFLI